MYNQCMLVDELQNKMFIAMKAAEKTRADTLRGLISELKNTQIDKPNMNEADEIAVVRREVKKRKDSIDIYSKAGRQDLVDAETAELTILEELLPAEMNEGDLESIVHEAIIYMKADSIGDMGRVMGEVMKRVEGKASGDRVAALVKEKLTKGNV